MAAEKSESANDSMVKPFPYQVAGHLVQDGFKVTEDDCVLKPVQRPPKGEREVIFYETVFDEAEERSEILQLRRFLPHYYGVVELASEPSWNFNTWISKWSISTDFTVVYLNGCKGMTRYLKLENITGRFNVPCVMDIKIGKVTWDDDVDDKFKETRRKKWPLKEITGFSILGFMVYNHARSCYERYNREWCLKLATIEDAEKAFQLFFGCIGVELTSAILKQLIAQLMEIKGWFTVQRLYRFLASSILIVYEGDTKQSFSIPQAFEEKDTRADLNVSYHQALKDRRRELAPEKTLVETRMIDTAHVFASSDVDDNYLFGLENIISTIQKLQSNL